jgi:8-oxo-dGTP diphosphatase
MIIDVAVALIRRHGDEYLIAKRANNGDLPGHWEFIGGKVEEDESPNEAVVREAREEIGAEILIEEIMDPFIFRYPLGTFKIFPFVCELLSRSDEICVDLDVHSEMRWVHLLDMGSSSKR